MLLAGIKEKAVLHGDFELSSGQRATTYVDLRRVLLDGRPMRTSQVVLRGRLRADRGGRVRWKLTMAEEG